MSGPRISVVIPVFNEVESLPGLHERLVEVMEGQAESFEIIYCDDGSTDGSTGLIEGWCGEDERVKAISFRRNFGQTAAMDAGFRHASGDVVVTMDADFQNDPADIPKLLEELDESHDVAKGWRKKRKDAFLTRILPSMIANWLISLSTGVRLHDYGCTLAAYRKEIVRELRLYGEMHRFIPAYAVWAGARIKEVPVGHRPRRHGRTKYGLGRTFRVILDLVTVQFLLGYATNPLYFFGRLGSVFLLFAFASAGWSVAKKIMYDHPVYTDPFFYITIFLGLAAIQVLLFGLLAELAMRTYYESQDRPTYVIRKTLNLDG